MLSGERLVHIKDYSIPEPAQTMVRRTAELILHHCDHYWYRLGMVTQCVWHSLDKTANMLLSISTKAMYILCIDAFIELYSNAWHFFLSLDVWLTELWTRFYSNSEKNGKSKLQYRTRYTHCVCVYIHKAVLMFTLPYVLFIQLCTMYIVIFVCLYCRVNF